jgi:hypothetical protein
MRFLFALFLLSLFILPTAKAQETLPGFTASLKANGKVVISWKNAYPSINQISIQRSKDSLRNFTTLITVPDPHIPENGFVDSKAEGTHMFYRLFILFGNSKYMFTKSKRAVVERIVLDRPASPKPVEKTAPKPNAPVKAPAVAKAEPAEEEDLIIPKIDNSRIFYMLQEKKSPAKPTVSGPGEFKTPTVRVEKTLFVKRRDSVIMRLDGNRVRGFSDSLLRKTKDTLLFVNADTLLIKPFIEPPVEIKEVYKVSPYVFTAKDGNVNIALSDWNKKQYSVRFFEEDNTPLLVVKNIRDPLLIIDKTNFLHSGWFRFELYEDGRLKEKNKFFIPKDF